MKLENLCLVGPQILVLDLKKTVSPSLILPLTLSLSEPFLHIIDGILCTAVSVTVIRV